MKSLEFGSNIKRFVSFNTHEKKSERMEQNSY